ncbi:MAG: hypothetical protein OEY18_17320, partial [Candidatus Aminicenantes bacterium]|nr:hypothetical protein [Candidatus Aminicenantes bacterium]
MRHKLYLIAGVSLFICTCLGFATFLRADSPGRLVIRRVDSPIKLDGLIDEPAWENLEPLPHVEHAPNFGEEPSERTVVFVGFDDDYLYLAGRLYVSDPSFIQGPTKKRDTTTPSNDFFGILIDSFNDKENGLA